MSAPAFPHPAVTPDDLRFMEAAIRYARRRKGLTGTNPSVGTLIVRDGVIVGRGVTAPGGRPHAEPQALAEAGEAARGATAYVTLEPCAHHGRTPPCAETLVNAGVARVVVAATDPDERVSGKGFAILRAAGIEVVPGILADKAADDLAGYLSRSSRKCPEVTLKLALSANGMIGQRGRGQIAITGPVARAQAHVMRAQSDVILIGIETALVNDPSLVVRVAGLRHLSPIRVVLDAEARLGPASALVAGAREVPLWLFVGPDAPPSAVARLEEAGVTVLAVGTGTGGLDMRAVMRHLAERGITRLLVEGGARIAATVVGQGLADEVVLFRAPVVIGPDGVRALAGGALSAIERSPRYRIVEDASLGEDRLIRFERTT